MLGREKEVSEITSEASADLSDFLALTFVTAISVPLARENLHLVIFVFEDPAAISPYSVV